MTAESPTRHLPVLDYMRGAAALSVCLFHFTNSDATLAKSDPLRILGSYGWLGVEVFFVISGFIIPYSMANARYTLRAAPSFLIKRFKRIEPPYFAVIAIILVLNYLSSLAPGYRGAPFHFSLSQVLLHLGYLTPFFGGVWLNPVFWTLAIEFQYYLFIALVFPLINHSRTPLKFFSAILLAALGGLGFGKIYLLPQWLPLFAMGILAFQQRMGYFTRRQHLVLQFVNFAIAYWINDLPAASAGFCSAMLISTWSSRPLPKVLNFLAAAGAISYSLYLLHTPIGGRVINLALRLPFHPAYRYPAIAIAYILSIFCAYLLWRFVERPCQIWSKAHRIQARNPESTI